MMQPLHTNRRMLTQEYTLYFNNTNSWTQAHTRVGLGALKAWKNEVTFKWVSINKSAGPFNILQCMSCFRSAPSPPVCWGFDRESAGIITNKYWFEYMALS